MTTGTLFMVALLVTLVVGAPTLYSVTIGALVVLAWRQRPSTLRTGVIVAGVVVLVVAACARIVPGAHWPSDTIGTVAICLSRLAVAFSAAGVPPR